MTAGAANLVEVVFSLVDSLLKARIVRERSRRGSQVGAEEDEIYAQLRIEKNVKARAKELKLTDKKHSSVV